MLTYPLEMYYPDYDFNVPKMEDQILVINEYKNYIEHCNKKDIEINVEKTEKGILKAESLLSQIIHYKEHLISLIER